MSYIDGVIEIEKLWFIFELISGYIDNQPTLTNQPYMSLVFVFRTIPYTRDIICPNSMSN